MERVVPHLVLSSFPVSSFKRLIFFGASFILLALLARRARVVRGGRARFVAPSPRTFQSA
jgi:hypothetical protein